MKLERVDKNNVLIVRDWLDNDIVGNSRIDFYKNTEGWLSLLSNDNRYGWIVFKVTRPIWFLDIETDDSHDASFTVYIAPRFRGMGFCKKVLQALVEEVSRIKVKTLRGYVESDHKSSKRCLDSAGFYPEGKDKDGLTEYRKELT